MLPQLNIHSDAKNPKCTNTLGAAPLAASLTQTHTHNLNQYHHHLLPQKTHHPLQEDTLMAILLIIDVHSGGTL